MRSSSGNQILVHLTALGVKYIRLKKEQIPSALKDLNEGRCPEGEELSIVPPMYLAAFRHLVDTDESWMLLADREGSSDKEEFSQPTDSKHPSPELQMALSSLTQELISAQIPQEHQNKAYTDLYERMQSFRNDSKQLTELYDEIKCGAAHHIGVYLAHHLLLEMGWTEEKEVQAVVEEKKESKKEPEAKKEPRFEYTLILSDGDPALRNRTLVDWLGLNIERLRSKLYLEKGFPLPPMRIRTASRSEQLENREFVLIRKGIPVSRGTFPDRPNQKLFLNELHSLFKASAGDWLTISQVFRLIEDLEETNGALVRGFRSSEHSIVELHQLLQKLLREGHSIHDPPSIMEMSLESPAGELWDRLIEFLSLERL